MYKVTIRLVDNTQLQFIEPSILRAAVRVQEYHEKMLFCDIQQMEGSGDINDGRKEDVYTENH